MSIHQGDHKDLVVVVDAAEGVAGMLAVDFGWVWHSVAAQLLKDQRDTHD